MSIYMSRAELEEISEGLITAYANKFSNRVIQSIDIEHFRTEKLFPLFSRKIPSYLINFFLLKRSRDVADLQWHTKRHIIS